MSTNRQHNRTLQHRPGLQKTSAWQGSCTSQDGWAAQAMRQLSSRRIGPGIQSVAIAIAMLGSLSSTSLPAQSFAPVSGAALTVPSGTVSLKPVPPATARPPIAAELPVAAELSIAAELPVAAAPSVAAADPSSSAPLSQIAYRYQATAETSGADPVAEAGPKALTTIDAVAKRLEEIQNNSQLDPAVKERLAKPLQQALEAWKQREADAKKFATYEQSLASVGDDFREAKRELDVKSLGGPSREYVDGLQTAQVSAQKSESDVELAARREEVQSLQAEGGLRKTRKAALPAEIQAARAAAEELASQPIADVADDPTGELKAALEAERLAKLTAARQRAKTLEKELALIEASTDLLPLQLAKAEKRLTLAEQTQRMWSESLRRRKQSHIQDALRVYREQLQEEGTPVEDSLVLRSDKAWLGTLAETERLSQLIAQEQKEAANLKQIHDEKKAAIDDESASIGGIRSSLGLELQVLQNKLPTGNEISYEIEHTDQEIESTRKKQTELEMIIDGAKIQTLKGFSIGPTTTLPRRDGAIHPREIELLEAYRGDVEEKVNKLLMLRIKLTEQQKAVDDLRLLIKQHVMWMRNASAFGWSDLLTSWETLKDIFHPSVLLSMARLTLEGMRQRLELALLAILSIAALVVTGARLRRRLADFGKLASARNVTTLRPTWSALVLTLALSLPLVVLLWTIGEAIGLGAESHFLAPGFAAAFKLAAAAIIPLELLRQLLRLQGLAIAHFDANESAVKPLRQSLRVLIDVGLPLLVIWRISQSLGRSHVDASLGRLAFAAGMLLITILIWQSMNPRWGVFSSYIRLCPSGWTSRLRHVWFSTLLLAPVILGCLSLNGYAYAANELVERLYWTLWICLLSYLVGGLLRRWLLTQRRRLAFAVRREQAEETERLNSGMVEIEADTSLDAAEINAQTKRLIHTTVVAATLVGVAWVWSPVLPAVQYLESFELWTTTLDDQTIVPVTLANLVVTLPIIILTIIAVRNLPGLVEAFLLERLPLEKAARYAITALGTYALAGVGLMVSAQTLGLRWESIQWLVAALGVGLGFGLQEIFANFISGIILLFEQPIRVGDVVTLGDTTGVVSKIRIRATTVTNWDRQELIIPNKDLVTGRLINWTLTDTTNRILVNVGVAYGSDTEKACALLRDICDQHPGVASDPAPVVTFEGFGDSTLNLVVRCYLTTLDNRLEVIHELHTAINRRFHDADLEIAFPQRDLHIRSLPPELMRRIARDSRESYPGETEQLEMAGAKEAA